MELNRHRIYAACVLCSLMSPTVFAAADNHFYSQQVEIILGVNHSYNSFSGLHLGSSTTPEVDKLDSSSDNNNFMWGMAYAHNILPWFVSYQKPDDNRILQHVLIGLDFLFFNTTDSGDTLQYAVPTMDNFEYEVDIQTSRIMLNAELDFKSFWKPVFPYLQMSVGGSQIMMGYKDQAKDPASGGAVMISDETNYNLTYSLGAGIKYLITPHFQVSASYLYTDFGVIKTEDDALTNRLWTSSGLFGFTYLFE